MGMLTTLAKKKLISSMKKDIKRGIEQGRIQFKDDKMEYTDKDGKAGIYSIDEASVIFWDKFETQFTSMGSTANATLLMFDIKPDDVKEIIMEFNK